MAYRDNWLKHLLATVNGKGFDVSLARDFWTSSEDLWDHRTEVPYRWLKLVFVYTMSGLAQVSVPLLLFGPILLPFTKHGDWRWWLFGVAMSAAFAIPAATLIATLRYVLVSMKSHALKRSATGVEVRDSADKELQRIFWLVFVIIPFFFFASLIYSGRFPG